MRLEIPGRPKPYVMGHRGNMAHRPENTLASFRLAIEQGVDLIETDLHVTADGEFVCIHDSTVDRTTNGSGAVGEMTLAEIKRLNAWNGFAGYENERVPTLAEAIEVLPPGIILALELKDDAFLKPEVGRRLAALLDETGMTERTVLLSFKLERVHAVQRVAPGIPGGFITLKRLTPMPGADLLGPFWPILFANPLYVRMAHRRGQPVCPLDPHPDSRLWYYRLLGCDAVLTNDPGATIRALGRG
ncbi:MAG TPA: glycerophosphodiester phosphodiesterase family protein [Aggregatilineales bacterium]|nr:hypothetical protein [Chloroflexota bacterium]HOA24660.1 glycerophosphodiester phosphodiesterase family protein [Aggregatilineales bacterium]HPV07387.1 glycerophosphodiester phosphodiesterase family protein [Aggregatilineales bacterium]HQA67916.1 glycerophosphodiester phosphodiesterase family protein [Aggregatilineales bacterium]HQE18251.1 glycerophosphodiester phosphodiesterase family protein [Aggregatilineales bacterium]